MTAALILICALLHTAGVIVGACYTTFAEVFYIKAASDGNIDRHERKYLRRLFRGMHLGMFVVLITGIAVGFFQYVATDSPHTLNTPAYWAVEIITFVMVLFSYTLSKRETPWWVASAAIFTGWWMLVALDFGRFNSIGFLPIIMMYLILSIVVAGVVGYVRMWVWHPKKLKL